MTSGFYRVHLAAGGSTFITAVVPLDSQGNYLPDMPRPHLFKANWEGCDYYGEVETAVERNGRTLYRLRWVSRDGGEYPSLTDFLTVPVAERKIFTVWDLDDLNSYTMDLVVIDMLKL